MKADGKTETTQFRVSTLADKTDVKSPAPEIAVKIEDVQPVTSDEAADPVPPGTPGSRAALSFTLQGAMMGRHDKTLFLGENTDFGMTGLATLQFLPGTPPEKKTGLEASAKHDGAQLELKFQNKVFRFPIKQHDQSEHDLEGVPGWKVRLVGYFPNFRMQDGKPTTIDDEPKNPAVCFELIGPDAKGVKVEDPHAEQGIDQELGVMKPSREVFFVFMKQNQVMARAVHGEPTKAQAKLSVALSAEESPIESANGLAVYLGDDGKLRYLLKSRKTGESTGTLELEKPLAVGWAPGAQFVVHELVTSARRKIVFTPHPEMKSKDMESVNLGLKCRVSLANGSAPEQELWIGQTTVENASRVPQEVSIGGKKVGFEFVNKTVVLPFTVALKKFNAPLTEGTNDFASFESILSFDERKDTVWLKSDSPSAKQLGSSVVTGAVTGTDEGKMHMTGAFGNEMEIDVNDVERTDIQTQKISMNRPTIFPITALAPFLGTSYKFSQASHHMPTDPTYSGVQVLRDPGWLLKWVGCVLICAGIFTMFYVIPYFRQSQKKGAVPAPAVAAVPAAAESKKKLRAAQRA